MSFFSSLIHMAEKSTELSKKVERQVQKNNKSKNATLIPKRISKEDKHSTEIHYETYEGMSSTEKDLYESNEDYRKKKDYLIYQDSLLKEVNEARDRYKNGGDIKDIIKAFEHAFKESDPPCSSSQCWYLVTLYLKNNQNDAAWEYLQLMRHRSALTLKNQNSIVPYTIQDFYSESSQISEQEARILKKEKRFKEAIRSYMFEYLEWIWAKRDFVKFEKDRFLKDIKPCANKLKWDEDKMDYLAYLVENNASRTDYNSIPMEEAYRQFLKDISKDEE